MIRFSLAVDAPNRIQLLSTSGSISLRDEFLQVVVDLRSTGIVTLRIVDDKTFVVFRCVFLINICRA
jgi:hypothetical protein